MTTYPITLIAYQSDIEHTGLIDWIEAHVSFLLPLHRYSGSLLVKKKEIYFSGMDNKTKVPFDLSIKLLSITDLYLGFDKIFQRIDDKGLGLSGFVPLRMGFHGDIKPEIIYIFANYSRILRQSDNKKLLKELERRTPPPNAF